MLLFNILLQIEELNTLILKKQNAVFSLIFVILHELHILPVQGDRLKCKKTLEPIWECSYMILLRNGLSKYLSLLVLTILNH